VPGGLAGTVAPSSAQRLVQSRRSKASRMSTMPKGTVLKTSMVARMNSNSWVFTYCNELLDYLSSSRAN